MPPLVATHLVTHPAMTAPLGVSEIVIDGKPFRVKQLQSKAYVENPYEKAALELTLTARIKALSNEVRKNYRLAVRVLKLPAHLQRQKISNLLIAKKRAELSAELGVAHLKPVRAAEYAERLVVSSQEISEERERMENLVRTVEGGVSSEA